jgi:hypothetical protein
MLTRWTCKPAMLSLSLGTTLVVAIVGCGGPAGDAGDAVVVPDASVVTTAPTPKAGGGASTPSPGAAAAPTSTGTSSAAAPVTAEGWGTLKGQIKFGGDAPTPKILREKGKAEKNPEICAKDGPIVSERLVVDSGTKGVRYALVYLSRPSRVNDEARKAASTSNPIFDQSKCMFEPHVMAIMTGSAVTLKSSDPMNHNVNVKLKQSPFNNTVAPGQALPFVPQGAERTPGEVICDIHPWMKAWWMVLDHPYFAVTDAKGNFELKNAPAGTQKLVVWQEAVQGNGFVTAPSGDEVVIKPNDTTVKDFTIEPGKLRPE